jgi:general secretion pathway protein D
MEITRVFSSLAAWNTPRTAIVSVKAVWHRMLYSPERNRLTGTVATDRGLPVRILEICEYFGRRHTFYKDIVEGRMGRGKITITPVWARIVRKVSLLFVLAGLYAVVPAAQAQSANTWSKRGADAEARQDYDAAFEDYQQAVQKKPKDLRYKAHMERVRFLAAAGHVDRGRILKQSGDLNAAEAEFIRAIQIDPSNQTAAQELQIVRQMMAAAPTSSNSQSTSHDQALRDIGAVASPIELQPASNELVSLHAVEDVKNIYQAIGKEAGLNVLFDPDYTSKRIPVDLTNVTLSDALRIVGTIAGTFYKPITPNTIFVAQNTRTKRTDLDSQAVQTFYLTNASQQADANEVLTALRNVLDPSTKITLVASQNAIIVRSTPDQLLLAEKLINDLDRSRSEVVVDVAILEVNRDKTTALGITLPTSVTLTPQASPTSTTSSTSTSTTTTSTTPSNFTLNTLANLNATNFAVSIGGGTLNAMLSDADTRVLQNPRIRATDGQHAILKIGEKIPIATGSYNAGVSTGVASIGVQTQFTYIDIGVNIDMTPTVHYDREVTLKLKVEDLTEASQVTISGVTEPVIGQNSAEQVVTLKDGEPTILAGILKQQDNLSVSGTPGLGELPFFKYLFSTQTREKQQDEIVFLIIPHIVRESILTRLNTRAIDTGTGQSIELRRDPSISAEGDLLPINPTRSQTIGQPTSAANAANAAVQEMKRQAAPPTPPTPPPANLPGTRSPGSSGQAPASKTTQPAGPPVSFSVVPPGGTEAVGNTFQVAVNLANGQDVYSVPLQVQFNPAVLQLVNVDAGDFLARDGQAVSIVHRDEGNGLITIATSRPPNTPGVSGQGKVATLTFKAIAPGDSNLVLVKVGAINSSQANVSATASQATVHVK